MSIRVVLVDDQPLVRLAVRTLAESSGDIEIVGEGATGEEAVSLVAATHPDVVVMDIRMPAMNGIDATAAIAGDASCAETRVLILTTYETDQYVFEALRAGAAGFLLKDAEPEDILRGIRTVASGDALLSPSVTRRVVERFAVKSAAAGVPGDARDAIADLTAREREVLSLIGKGLSNDEIGERLFMSPQTARTHVSRILGKTGCRDRAQLVVIAYESGVMRE